MVPVAGFISEEMGSKLVSILYLILIQQAIATIFFLAGAQIEEKTDMGIEAIKFSLPLLSIMLYISSFLWSYMGMGIWAFLSIGAQAQAVWLLYYSTIFFANFLTTIFYLTCKTIFGHKLIPETWMAQEKFPATEETLYAHREIFNLLLNCCVPFITIITFASL